MHGIKQTKHLHDLSHTRHGRICRRLAGKQPKLHLGSHRLYFTVPDHRRTPVPPAKEKIMDKKSALEATLVNEFVGNAHADLDRVKELLAQEPALVNAVWDWGGGDFESALGAAAHMGRKDIANFLLDHGARLDLFAAAMLGNLEIVKAALDAFPDAINTPGPHGIPLIKHAEIGGEDAKPVLEYLNSIN